MRWYESEPEILERERLAMTQAAPEMVWDSTAPAGAWEGLAPVWPFARAEPQCLRELLAGRRFTVRAEYLESFPAVEPRLFPIDPAPEPIHRTDSAWHTNGDGSLCLLRDADMWTVRETAADLVVKAAGWFIEYLLLEAGRIDRMTLAGINTDDQLDEVIEEFGCTVT